MADRVKNVAARVLSSELRETARSRTRYRPHTRPPRFARRHSHPPSISPARTQASIATFTHAGTGTVRSRPPLPTTDEVGDHPPALALLDLLGPSGQRPHSAQRTAHQHSYDGPVARTA